MAKIQKVDYVAMPKNAKEMRRLGQELNKEVKEAYKSVEDMHSVWFGERYNELLKVFNGMTTHINEMLQLVVTEFPVSLEKVANNYSQADQGSNVTTVDNSSPEKITSLSIKKDVGMGYLSESVEEIRSSVSTNFKNAKTKMSEIGAEYNKITWQSEASDSFKNRFDKLKTSIENNFNDIETSFSQLMKAAAEDVQKAENANKGE